MNSALGYAGVVRHAARLMDLWLWVRAFLALATVPVALQARGLPRLVSRSQPSQLLTSGRSPRAEDIHRARHYARLIESAARHHVVRVHCLQRSIVLHRWLLREALPSEMRIGVRKHNGELHAHAWVELGGEVVNDRRAVVSAFRPLRGSDGERQPSTASADLLIK